jgi:hypothetical protein
MLASLALVPAAIAVLAPAGPDEGCPSPRQVVEALGAHLPGVALPLGQPPGPSALRLRVATDATGATLLDLGDANGETVLRRALVPTDRAPACGALAETVALIIERYWREVGYDVPPLEVTPEAPTPVSPPPAAKPPPPPPEPAAAPWRWGVGLLASVRSDHGALGSAGLAASLQGRIGVRLSGQISQSESAMLPFATAHFRRYPVRLGGYVPLRLGPGQLEPGIGLDLDEISVALTNVTAGRTLGSASLCSGVFCASPGLDVALGWSAWSTHHVFIRALTRAEVAVPYRFVAAESNAVVWSTPRTYLEAAIECGLWFP